MDFFNEFFFILSFNIEFIFLNEYVDLQFNKVWILEFNLSLEDSPGSFFFLSCKLKFFFLILSFSINFLRDFFYLSIIFLIFYIDEFYFWK